MTCPSCRHPWHGFACAGWDPDERADDAAGACGCPTSYVEAAEPSLVDEVPC